MSDDLPKNYTWKKNTVSEVEKPIEILDFKKPIIQNSILDSDEIDLN